MTTNEREASIQRILQAVKNTVKTVSDELQKATDMMDPDATHGAGIELLRGAPELAESLGYAVPGLTATATLLAVELRPEAGSLRDPVETLWNDQNGDDRRDAHAQTRPASGRLLSGGARGHRDETLKTEALHAGRQPVTPSPSTAVRRPRPSTGTSWRSTHAPDVEHEECSMPALDDRKVLRRRDRVTARRGFLRPPMSAQAVARMVELRAQRLGQAPLDMARLG